MRSPSSLGHFLITVLSEPSQDSYARSLFDYRPVRTVTGLIISKTTGFNFNTHSFERVTKNTGFNFNTHFQKESETGFMVVSTRMYRIGTYVSDTNIL